MKKVCLLFALMIFIVTSFLFGVDLTEYGMEINSTEKVDGFLLHTVTDDQNRTFEIFTADEITPEDAERLIDMKNRLYSWDYLAISNLRIAVTTERIEFTVIPESFIYNDIDFAEYLPSGMQFFLDEYIEYDFRMLIDDFALKMKGQLFNEEQLAEKMSRAVENPALYFRTSDPTYLYQRIEGVSEYVEQVNAQLRAVIDRESERWQAYLEAEKARDEQLEQIQSEFQQTFADARLEFARIYESAKRTFRNTYTDAKHDFWNIYSEAEATLRDVYAQARSAFLDLERRHLRLKQNHEVLLENHSDLEQRHEDLKTAYEQLKKDHDQLQQNHLALQETVQNNREDLTAELAQLKQAVFMTANQGLFSTIVKTNWESVQRLIELKQQNPGLTQDEIKDKLKEEGYKVSGREITMAFMIYFNEMGDLINESE